ncbi:MAG: replication-associated recombination protein A [Acidimicrobiales bacterium]|jgi:putative ATPase
MTPPRRSSASGGGARQGETSLFDAAVDAELAKRAPLAARLRPQSLDDVIGQRHLLAPGAPLRTLVEADRLSSAVFYGPPGTGKTSVARLVALHTKRRYRALSAVEAGVKDVRTELDDARQALGTEGIGTIMFLDEVHRFNKAQQDALLHGVEDGVVVLIGATTENPFFALNTPLLSRSTLWRFEPLSEEEVGEVARRAAGADGAIVSDEAVALVADLASGDARVAITVIEVAVALARGESGRRERAGAIGVEAAHIDQARSMRAFRHGTEEHYNLVSALIKSVRGSDPDAGLYWLARLIEVGEDPRFVARRLVILASEDVGMADPMSLVVASAAAQAVELVGLPEAALNLSQAVIHLSLAPKSNSAATAIWQAQEDVRSGPFAPVPPHLRGANYYGASAVGSGIGYEYPHDDPRGYLEQQYLPDELAGRRYYVPRGHGAEGSLAKRWRERRGESEPASPQEETSP